MSSSTTLEHTHDRVPGQVEEYLARPRGRHPSHEWGNVLDPDTGERVTRCIDCLADPSWGLAAYRCVRPGRDSVETAAAPPRAPKVHITLEEVRTAISLRDSGRTWLAIGNRLGRGVSVIHRAVARFERGEGRLAREAGRERRSA